MWKGCLVECFGMAVYVWTHTAIVMASASYTYPPLLIGIFHGVLLSLFILQFAASSGAHFNSMITFSTMLTGHTPFFRGLCYIPAQILGAFIGALCMKASVMPDFGMRFKLGACHRGPMNSGQALMIEVVSCLLVLFAAYGTAFNARQNAIYGPVFVPLFSGLMLVLIIFCSSSLGEPPFTGAGVNPPLCLGCSAAYALYDDIETAVAFEDQWIYWVGPGISSILHGVMYLIAPPHHHALYQEQKALRQRKKEEKSMNKNSTD
eukprot:TRINITY_DN1755_c0_g1_i1.p1 TRINITY_DN1755_c0_g1~~TRINITY_DN1755_c0_g1_i1.p1  ORF type:complete len:263 (-),score=17.82 TRINITY_DN1755_c0_g1_i1:28-816(-)